MYGAGQQHEYSHLIHIPTSLCSLLPTRPFPKQLTVYRTVGQRFNISKQLIEQREHRWFALCGQITDPNGDHLQRPVPDWCYGRVGGVGKRLLPSPAICTSAIPATSSSKPSASIPVSPTAPAVIAAIAAAAACPAAEPATVAAATAAATAVAPAATVTAAVARNICSFRVALPHLFELRRTICGRQLHRWANVDIL